MITLTGAESERHAETSVSASKVRTRRIKEMKVNAGARHVTNRGTAAGVCLNSRSCIYIFKSNTG